MFYINKRQLEITNETLRQENERLKLIALTALPKRVIPFLIDYLVAYVDCMELEIIDTKLKLIDMRRKQRIQEGE